jgi:hypothetical protein
MTDTSLLAGQRPQQPNRRRPGEHVWTMTKGSEQARAELRDQGAAGVELQVFRGDDFANGRLYASRMAADARKRLTRLMACYCADGWIGGSAPALPVAA